MPVKALYDGLFKTLHEDIPTIDKVTDKDCIALKDLSSNDKQKLKQLLESFKDELNLRSQNLNARDKFLKRIIDILKIRDEEYTQTLDDLQELYKVSANISGSIRETVDLISSEVKILLSEQREVQYRYFKAQLVLKELAEEKDNIRIALANIVKIEQILEIP